MPTSFQRLGFRSACEAALTEGAQEAELNADPPPAPAQPQPLPINLLYPGLNMSQADVTLRLRGGADGAGVWAC